jgi:hypothetical protein
MSKYYRIPFYKVGESAPNLLLMLDEHYEKSDWFVRFERMPVAMKVEDNDE